MLATYHVMPGKLTYLRLLSLYDRALLILKARRGGGAAPASSAARTAEESLWQWALEARDSL